MIQNIRMRSDLIIQPWSPEDEDEMDIQSEILLMDPGCIFLLFYSETESTTTTLAAGINGRRIYPAYISIEDGSCMTTFTSYGCRVDSSPLGISIDSGCDFDLDLMARNFLTGEGFVYERAVFAFP